MSKSQKRPGKMLGFYADNTLDERLTRAAEKAKISKSQLVKNLMECALDQMEAMNRVGMLSMGVFFADFKKNFNQSVETTINQVLHPETEMIPPEEAEPSPSPSSNKVLHPEEAETTEIPPPVPSPPAPSDSGSAIRVKVIEQSLPGLG